MLPQRTSILIVGAGPAGMALAISLFKQGCKDFVIVDGAEEGLLASRAMVIHAATLEALDTIGCADPLVQIGIKGQGLKIRNATSTLLSIDFKTLESDTQYPYVLCIPQTVTENVLRTELGKLGVQILRPYKVTGMARNKSEGNAIDVSFDTGDIIQAKYIIGADGSRSAVRKLSGISFRDPETKDGVEGPSGEEMVLADVTFSSTPTEPSPMEGVNVFLTDRGSAILIPLPELHEDIYARTPPALDHDNDTPSSPPQVWRLACTLTCAIEAPPPNPPIEYLQRAINMFGPANLSSDTSINPNPVKIATCLWSSKFKIRSAIADQAFKRFESGSGGAGVDSSAGGVVFLVGDAAHIHSPAGGQGMNLGLRDAIGLAPVLVAHLQASGGDLGLQEYADARHARALEIIALTKRMNKIQGVMSTPILGWGAAGVMKVVSHVPAITRNAAWGLSGLAERR
ncbi:FAD/NAD(P)-binding domain-containing protein [Athelia psychrophila]|uniref:FAD/NAD(P)-binding domain-containing protein n=1 Tax=Athelia psychrophila TaxID=1759441 RepID=A0A166M7K4_9AGAM|nr:FAD/NAD(P)-binding domain-containing protein [Fibularhizoctonia sp. CBS 109695]